MNISYSWLKSLLPGLDATPQQIADMLAMQGAPVDEIVDIGGPLRDIRIARVVEAGRHPNADRLSLCKVDPGNGEMLQVVCGAPNVKSGGVYPFAPVGTRMPDGLVIKKSKIRGEESQGMLCSARELGLGKEHDGIMELASDTPIGASLLDVLQLDDSRIVVDVTPNRPDLLSHLGVAREVGASFNIEPALPALQGESSKVALSARASKNTAGELTVEIRDADLCSRYIGLIIRGVKVGPSPAWLAGPLRAIGLRPISNVVDATNYVLHELGQPMHAFDLKKAGSNIVVRRAKGGEKIRTLDDVERTLQPGMLVIADAEKPIAIAGVMGGGDTEVDDGTTDILLECALFDASSVRSTRRAIGISSDASYRYERGVDPDMMETALHRAAQLIHATSGGTADPVAVDAGTQTSARKSIDLRLKRITQLLGVPFAPKRVSELLAPLGFDVTGDGEKLSVRVPGHRSYDVTREEDLIEEVARRHGYDNFPDELRAFRPTAVPDDAGAQMEDRLRDQLVALGMMESRTLAFAAPGFGDVALLLPLSSAEGFLRSSIVPALLRRVEQNYTRGQRHVRLFEISTAFKRTSEPVPSEARHVAAVFTGARAPAHWTGDAPAFDLWDLKGTLETICSGLALTVAPAGPPSHENGSGPNIPSWADATACWAVHSANGAVVGFGGRVLPESIDAPAWADAAFAFEIDLTTVAGAAGTLAFRTLPAYPAVERDLALLTPHDLDAAVVLGTIRQSAGPLMETAFPFDVYRGKGVDESLRSVAVRLRFRANDRTLTDDEVDRAIGRVLGRLKEEHGIERRG